MPLAETPWQTFVAAPASGQQPLDNRFSTWQVLDRTGRGFESRRSHWCRFRCLPSDTQLCWSTQRQQRGNIAVFDSSWQKIHVANLCDLSESESGRINSDRAHRITGQSTCGRDDRTEPYPRQAHHRWRISSTCLRRRTTKRPACSNSMATDRPLEVPHHVASA